MAIRSIAQLKAWFKRGMYPTGTQFSDWLDSYFHKEEKIPVASVDQLPEQLNGKYPDADGKLLERKTTKIAADLDQHEQYAEEKFGTIYDRLDELDETKIDKAVIGQPNGVAGLDEQGRVPAAQLPSYVDDVLEFPTVSAFPSIGETGKIYVATNTNLTYRWSGTQYVEISPSVALGETSATAYPGDKGRANAQAIVALRNEKLDKSVVGQAGGVASLDAEGKVPQDQIAGSGGGGSGQTLLKFTFNHFGETTTNFYNANKIVIDTLVREVLDNKTPKCYVEYDIGEIHKDPIDYDVIKTNSGGLTIKFSSLRLVDASMPINFNCVQGTIVVTNSNDPENTTSVTAITDRVKIVKAPSLLSYTSLSEQAVGESWLDANQRPQPVYQRTFVGTLGSIGANGRIVLATGIYEANVVRGRIISASGNRNPVQYISRMYNGSENSVTGDCLVSITVNLNGEMVLIWGLASDISANSAYNITLKYTKA